MARPRPLHFPPPPAGAGGASHTALAAVLAELRAIRALLEEVVTARPTGQELLSD
jgi:hypothetical protein